LTNTLRV